MEAHISNDKRHYTQEAHEYMHMRTVGVRTWMKVSAYGSRVVGIEGLVDDERPRHRNTGAKMVMDGCMSRDRVNEVQVRHVQQAGHGVVLDCDLRDLGCFILGVLKRFQIWQKVSGVVIFGVIYLLN